MIEAIIYREEADDYTIWFPDLPREAEEEIDAILDRYRNTGYSARGTLNDIKEELL